VALKIRDVPDSNFLKIRPKLDSTGYQIDYPAETGTGYLNTCCIAIFMVFCAV